MGNDRCERDTLTRNTADHPDERQEPANKQNDTRWFGNDSKLQVSVAIPDHLRGTPAGRIRSREIMVRP